MRWQTGAAVALLAALATVAVVAFAQDGGTPEVEASAPPTATADPSPSPGTPSPSPSPSPELVLPDNDVEDPLEAIVAIEAYRDWLFENPDPDLVRFIYHQSCGCRRPLQDALARLSGEGERVVLLGDTEFSGLTVEPGDTDRIVWVDYDLLLPAARQVAADGSVIEERPPATESIHRRVELLRDPSGRWVVLWLEDSSRG